MLRFSLASALLLSFAGSVAAQETTKVTSLMSREYQSELAEHGITDHAKRLDLDIWQAMRMAPASTRYRWRRSTGWHTTPRDLPGSPGWDVT